MKRASEYNSASHPFKNNDPGYIRDYWRTELTGCKGIIVEYLNTAYDLNYCMVCAESINPKYVRHRGKHQHIRLNMTRRQIWCTFRAYFHKD